MSLMPNSVRYALISVDMSLRSPGFTLVVKKPNHLQPVFRFFAFGSYPKTIDLCDGNSLNIWNGKDIANGEDLDRYQKLIEPIVSDIVEPLLKNDNFKPEEISVAVESYAFPARSQAGSNYKLHESCGILKHVLFTIFGIKNIFNVSPMTWRSRTVKTLEQNENLPQNHKLLSLRFFNTFFPETDLLSLCSKKLGKNNSVPTPVQDIADSFCLAASVLADSEPFFSMLSRKKNVQNRKRKRDAKDVTLFSESPTPLPKKQNQKKKKN